MNWSRAYFEQAQSDLEVFKKLNLPEVPLSHRLHYLQMATEKLAKAHLTQGKDEPKLSHSVLVSFLQVCKQRPELRRLLGYAHDYRAFSSYVDSMLPTAEKVQRLAPQAAGRNQPNPEYPWEDRNTATVMVPAQEDFSQLFSKQELASVARLIYRLFGVSEHHFAG